jgi:arabinofuranosyltransferase
VSDRALARALLAAAVVVAAAAAWRASIDTLDDAFISFRAVHNAVAGRGLTFNPGAPPVESFSNPLFVLLLAPFAALGVPLPLAAALLGALGLGLVVVATHRLARASGLGALAEAAALSATLGATPLVYFGLTGLETSLYAGLLAAALARSVARGASDPLACVLWALAASSRPEAPLPVLLALVSLATRPLDRRAWAPFVVVLGTLGVLELARIAYYGDVVPNTFHAKPPGTADHDPSTFGPLVGLAYVARFSLGLGLVLPLGAAVAVREGKGTPALRGALALVLGGLVFALYAGGDWMPMGRYLVPYVPFVALAGAAGIEALARRGSVRAGVALGLAGAAALAGSVDQLTELVLHARDYPYHVMGSRDSIAAIERMRPHLPPGARVVAFRIGALGDVGGYHVIDLLGLVDRRIAAIAADTPGYHPQRSRMGDDVPALRALVQEEDPDAVLLVTYADGPLDPAIALYGLRFAFAEAYPIGRDQRWALYVRAP